MGRLESILRYALSLTLPDYPFRVKSSFVLSARQRLPTRMIVSVPLSGRREFFVGTSMAIVRDVLLRNIGKG
jgi:hypothetical protein